MALTDKLSNIGNAIREKTGKSELIPLDSMPDEIKKIPNGGSSINPDWNQNDETAPDYIKNRPFYYDYEWFDVITSDREIPFSIENGPSSDVIYGSAMIAEDWKFNIGNTLKIIFDGKEYQCDIVPYIRSGFFLGYFAGNPDYLEGIFESSAEIPFAMMQFNDGSVTGVSIMAFGSEEVHTISHLSVGISSPVKISKDFLNLPDWNVSDEESPSYILNRPFYSESSLILNDEPSRVAVGMNYVTIPFSDPSPIVADFLYKIEGSIYYRRDNTDDIDENYEEISLSGLYRGTLNEDGKTASIVFNKQFYVSYYHGYVTIEKLYRDPYSSSYKIDFDITADEGGTNPKIYVKCNFSVTPIKQLDPIYIPSEITNSILPKYAAEDEGKVLKIVDGVPAWVTP